MRRWCNVSSMRSTRSWLWPRRNAPCGSGTSVATRRRVYRSAKWPGSRSGPSCVFGRTFVARPSRLSTASSRAKSAASSSRRNGCAKTAARLGSRGPRDLWTGAMETATSSQRAPKPPAAGRPSGRWKRPSRASRSYSRCCPTLLWFIRTDGLSSPTAPQSNCTAGTASRSWRRTLSSSVSQPQIRLWWPPGSPGCWVRERPYRWSRKGTSSSTGRSST